MGRDIYVYGCSVAFSNPNIRVRPANTNSSVVDAIAANSYMIGFDASGDGRLGVADDTAAAGKGLADVVNGGNGVDADNLWPDGQVKTLIIRAAGGHKLRAQAKEKVQVTCKYYPTTSSASYRRILKGDILASVIG
jgi:hypothetical protein